MLLEMEKDVCDLQEIIRKNLTDVLYGTTKTQKDILKEIGISQYTYRNFMLGRDIGRISRVRIEEWIARQTK